VKEKPSVIAQRNRYLRLLDLYRQERRNFFWQGESWINSRMTVKEEWYDPDGFDTKMAVSRGVGSRTILCGVGSDTTGWLPGSFLYFRGKKNKRVNPDYHGEMNWELFSKWLKEKAIPSLPDRAVLVLDRASYHLLPTDATRPASSKLTKAELVEWLAAHNALPRGHTAASLLQHPAAGGFTRAELWELCKQNKPVPIYQVQQLLDAQGRDLRLLILPVHHPELNPIECMWARLKNNVTFTQTEVERLCMEEVERVTAEDWAGVMRGIKDGAEKCYREAREVEEEEDLEDSDDEVELE